MPDRTTFLWAWVTSLSLTLACGTSRTQTISLGNADAGRTVVAAVGDKVEVTLQTIGPGQYGNPIVSSGAVMFLGEASAGVPNPGGARQLYRFEAVATGRTDITIPHTGDVPEFPANPAFAVTVHVQ